MKETWKIIPKSRNLYLISNLGRVKRASVRLIETNGKQRLLLKTAITTFAKTNHYRELNIFGKRRKVHRLVANAFLKNQDRDKTEVNHKNGIKSDNRVENLEWVTRSENMLHAFVIGLNKPSPGNSKLNREKVEQIRKSYPKYSVVELSLKYGMHRSTIWKIVKGLTWKE